MALRQLLLPWDAQPQEVCDLGGALARGVVMLAMPTRPDRDLLGQSSLTPSGAPVGVGPGGRAWHFSGGSGSVLVPHRADFNLTTEFTIFALVRSTDATGQQYVLNKNFNGTNSVPMSLAIGGTPVQQGLSFFQNVNWRASGIGGVDIRGDNRVHAVAGTFSSSQELAYWVDGVQRSSANFAVGPIATTTDVYIGRYQNDAQSFRGEIYLVGISSRAWSAHENAAFAENPWQLFEPRRIFVPVSAGGGSYTLTAESGSYTLAGQAAGLQAARTLAADAGSYTLMGQDVAMQRGQRLVADAGSYTLTGVAAVLSTARVLAADAGTYVLSGQAAGLTKTTAGAFTLAADAGSYSLNGQPVNLAAARRLLADAGAYALTGQAVGLAKTSGYTITAAAGSYALSGQAVGFARAWLLQLDAGAYALTGRPVALTYSGAALPALTVSPMGRRLFDGRRSPRLSTATRPPRTSSSTR